MDPRYADLARAARTLVDGSFLSSWKEKRPSSVVLATVALWLQLTLAWAIALYGPIWLIVISFIIVCALTQAMVLWVHEASHFSLFDSKRLNDIWCDVFFAAPIGITVAAYRLRHSSHHADLGTAKDLDGYPYQMSVRGTRSLVLVLARSLSGLLGVWLVKNKYIGGERASTAQVSPRWIGAPVTISFNLALIFLCVLSGRWYVYFAIWIYPIVAVAIALNIVRSVAEHQPEDFPDIQDGVEVAMRPVARTTTPNWFEKWLLYQANFNYHVEHHIFPTVPRHNLRKLHLHLVAKGFYKQFPEALQRSGFGTFWRLARNKTNNDFSEAISDAFRL